MSNDDDYDECGLAFDHDLNLTSDRDGIRIYECRHCGAEIFEEDEEVQVQ